MCCHLRRFCCCGSAAQVSEQEVLQSCVWTPQKISALSGVKAKQACTKDYSFWLACCGSCMHLKALALMQLQVCCSLDSSLVVGADGTLFTFGDNSLAQLGRAPGYAPEHSVGDWVVTGAHGAPLRVGAVAAGLSHCLATTGDGQARMSAPQHFQGLDCKQLKEMYCEWYLRKASREGHLHSGTMCGTPELCTGI